MFCAGAHVPLTSEGIIIVDGILVSCYASFHHDVSHIAMKPIQWSPMIIQWMFSEENESATFMKTAKQLGKWLNLDLQFN